MLGRARVGRDWQSAIPPLRRACFNPRARVGRDTWNRPCRRVYQSFNPRARVGRDSASAFSSLRQSVSIHAPAWGATPSISPDRVLHIVSILAPAWGATRHAHGLSAGVTVSIHAPAWGATRQPGFPKLACVFQSTRPRGARLIYNEWYRDQDLVSIHAPAWGAT